MRITASALRRNASRIAIAASNRSSSTFFPCSTRSTARFRGSADPAYLDYRKGFELIRRQLWEALAKQGLVRIDALGQEFNPHFHHAIESVETTEHADGIVIGEMQPGYLFHERVLRPAMVRVASAPEPKSAHVSKHEH